MKPASPATLIVILFMSIALLAAGFVVFGGVKKTEKAIGPPRHSLEGQVALLERAGIHLAAERTIDELFLSYPRENYLESPYTLLLTVLGSEVEQEPWGRYFSSDIWYLDTESIFDNDSYATVVNRMATLTGGGLEFTGVQASVDFESQTASIEFELEGRHVALTPVVHDDWIDQGIFITFVRLAEEQGLEGRYTYLDLGGQDCLIGFATQEQMRKLQEDFGLAFEWLK